MANVIDPGGLDYRIRSGYPYPLAATYYRAFYGSSDRDEIHEYLLDLFEVTLKFLASIAMSQYLAQEVNDPQVNKDLLALERPSLGHWQGWLRDILALYRRERRPLLVPELGELYLKKHAGDIGAGYGSLRQVMTERLGYEGSNRNPAAVTTQQFFELLGEYRNRLAHGARPSRYDRERVADILMPAMRQLFAELAFLADYPLVYVNMVSVEFVPGDREKSRFVHHLTYLTGDRPRVSQRPEILDQNPAHARELYLLDKGGGFVPLLSLHPFLIFRHCESCNAEQAFVLNTSREKTLDYLSYQCTHHFNPTEYVEYMTSLLNEIRRASGVASRGPSAASAPPAVTAATSDIPAATPEVEREVPQEPATPAPEIAALAVSAPSMSAPATGQETLPVVEAQFGVEDMPGQSRVGGDVSASAEHAALAVETSLAAPADLPSPVAAERPLASLTMPEPSPSDKADATHAVAPSAGGDSGPAASVAAPAVSATVPLGVAEPASQAAVPPPAPRGTRQGARISPMLLGAIGLLVLGVGTAVWLLLPRTTTGPTTTPQSATATPQGATIGPQNAAGLQLLRSWQADPSEIYGLAFTPDGTGLVSAGNEGLAQIWNVADGTPVVTMTGHTDRVFTVAVSPDGQTVASASEDGTVRLWNASSGALLNTLHGTDDHSFLRVAFSPSDPLLVAIGDMQGAHYWRLPGGEPADGPPADAAYNLAFSSDGKLLGVARYAGMDLWPMAGGNPLELEAPPLTLWAMAFDRQGQYVAGGSGDGTIRLWRPADGALLGTIAAHKDEVFGVTFSPNGQLLASGSKDGAVKLWQVPSGTELATMLQAGSAVGSVVFSPAGDLFAAGGDGGKIYLWRAQP